jgi:hypothetical protein
MRAITWLLALILVVLSLFVFLWMSDRQDKIDAANQAAAKANLAAQNAHSYTPSIEKTPPPPEPWKPSPGITLIGLRDVSRNLEAQTLDDADLKKWILTNRPKFDGLGELEERNARRKYNEALTNRLILAGIEPDPKGLSFTVHRISKPATVPSSLPSFFLP